MTIYDQTKITPKQVLYIQELASGKNAPQIAADNFVSTHTVRNTISNAKERVGAKSTFHLVSMAIINEWIHPEI